MRLYGIDLTPAIKIALPGNCSCSCKILFKEVRRNKRRAAAQHQFIEQTEQMFVLQYVNTDFIGTELTGVMLHTADGIGESP